MAGAAGGGAGVWWGRQAGGGCRDKIAAEETLQQLGETEATMGQGRSRHEGGRQAGQAGGRQAGRAGGRETGGAGMRGRHHGWELAEPPAERCCLRARSEARVAVSAGLRAPRVAGAKISGFRRHAVCPASAFIRTHGVAIQNTAFRSTNIKAGVARHRQGRQPLLQPMTENRTPQG